MVRILHAVKPTSPQIEKRRKESREYQQRRRAALKEANPEEREQIRNRDQQHHAQYRKNHRWVRMMDERRRRNTEPDSCRVSKIKYPEDLTATALSLHSKWNNEIISRREKRKKQHVKGGEKEKAGSGTNQSEGDEQ